MINIRSLMKDIFKGMGGYIKRLRNLGHVCKVHLSLQGYQ